MASSSNLSTAPVAISRAVVISGVLLRVGISGVALAVWAAAGLFSAERSFPTAIAGLVAGVAIAALSLRRGWTVLDQEGERPAHSRRAFARRRPHVVSEIAGAPR